MDSRLFPLGMVLLVAVTAFSKTPMDSDTRHETPSPSLSNPAPLGLEEALIHTAYMEGDFETVIARIEGFRKANTSYSKSDSVFIAKHLAVVYSANPATREMGKSYMFRLLNLLPSAKIVDMFVSDEIDHIFERVREEYAIRLKALGKTPEPADTVVSKPSQTLAINDSSAQPKSPPASEKRASRIRPVYWWAGGAAVFVATGAITYFVMADTHSAKETYYDIPH